MPPIVTLYNTFGSGSAPRRSRSGVQLTDMEERLEEWKERDDDTLSDISKEDADITTALIGEGGDLGEPEVRRRFWATNDGKGKELDLDAIATQVRRNHGERYSASHTMLTSSSPVFSTTPTSPTSISPGLTGTSLEPHMFAARKRG